MPLAPDIEQLRTRALAELAKAHDYYADTKAAWDFVRENIQAGRKITIRNRVTGTVAKDARLVEKAHQYVAGQLAETTFQQFVAIFEDFFFDLLRLWLQAHPHSLAAKQLDFKTVLDAPDKEAITLEVINRELNEVMYKRPKDWFAYLEGRAKLGCPTDAEIERIGEIKAARDVLAHNRGVANRVYQTKAGKLSRAIDGEKLDIAGRYHLESWQLLCKVIDDISKAALAKTK